VIALRNGCMLMNCHIMNHTPHNLVILSAAMDPCAKRIRRSRIRCIQEKRFNMANRPLPRTGYRFAAPGRFFATLRMTVV
jgi:hypothetical protein